MDCEEGQDQEIHQLELHYLSEQVCRKRYSPDPQACRVLFRGIGKHADDLFQRWISAHGVHGLPHQAEGASFGLPGDSIHV